MPQKKHAHNSSEPQRVPPKTATDLDNELHEILFGYARDAESSLERAKTRLRTEVIPLLNKHHVANIEAAYSGSGDEGAIDGLQYRDAAGQRVERKTLPPETIEALEACLFEFLPEGFEINDGSQGTLTLDLPSGRLSIQHQENYTATSESSREWHV